MLDCEPLAASHSANRNGAQGGPERWEPTYLLQEAQMRKKLTIAGIVVVLLIAAVWGGSAIYASIQNNQAREAFTLTPQTPGISAPPETDPENLSGVWQISPGSQAGYRVEEVLNGQDATVVGRTDEVRGQVTVTGTELTAGDVEVQMGAVTTDSNSRDNQFQGILKTSEFPTSTFTLTDPVDIAAIAGGTASVTAVGDLTIAGVSRSVSATLNLQMSDGGVQVQGAIPITFSDFGVSAPNLGFVQVQDSGSVEMLLLLNK